jgi:hypothetical protein
MPNIPYQQLGVKSHIQRGTARIGPRVGDPVTEAETGCSKRHGLREPKVGEPRRVRRVCQGGNVRGLEQAEDIVDACFRCGLQRPDILATVIVETEQEVARLGRDGDLEACRARLALDLKPIDIDLAARQILGDQQLTIDRGLAQRPHRLDAREDRIEPPSQAADIALHLEVADIDRVGHDPNAPAGEVLRRHLRDNDIVALPVDVLDALEDGPEVAQRDLLSD